MKAKKSHKSRVHSLFRLWWLWPALVLAVFAITATIVYLRGNDPSRQTAQSMVRACTSAQASDFGCWQERYQAIIAQDSAQAAFADLKTEYARSEYVVSQCHQLTHVIGRASAERYGSVPEAFNKGDNFCWSGYYHGVMEAVVKQVGLSKLAQEANNICAGIGADERYSFYHYNCVHGLGHGFMAAQNDEIFTSLDTCDNLVDTWERQSCYGGVFMENVISGQSGFHEGKYLIPSRPYYPCSEVKEYQKNQCYLMQTSYMLQVNSYDFAKVFDLCSKAESAYVDTCYQSLGRDASGQSISNVDKTSATCLLGQDDRAQLNCAVGAVKDFISYYHDDNKATELCRKFSGEVARTCDATRVEYYKTF